MSMSMSKTMPKAKAKIRKNINTMQINNLCVRYYLQSYSNPTQCHAFIITMFYVSKMLTDRVLRNKIDGGGGVWARQGWHVWNDTWGYICVSTIPCPYLVRVLILPYPSLSSPILLSETLLFPKWKLLPSSILILIAKQAFA